MAVTGLQINIRLPGMIYSATRSARELTEKRKKKKNREEKTSGSVVTLLIRGIGQSPVQTINLTNSKLSTFPFISEYAEVKFERDNLSATIVHYCSA